jgi:phasin
METTMSFEADSNAAINNFKQAFAPVTEAFAKFQTLEVPEATRDFVKRATDNAKTKASDFQAASEKMTSAIEAAVSTSVSEAVKINRTIQGAFYQDVEAFFAGLDKLASAKSVTEALQIQGELARAHGTVLASRAKSSTEYLGKLVTDGAKTAQDNISEAASYAKTA